MRKNYILIAGFFFLISCAKPTVVEVIQPNDKMLNCNELKNEIIDSQKIKEEAEFSKDSGGNIARIILFWPAWAQSLHNADEAILAANSRKHHLIKILKSKNCEGSDLFIAKIRDSKPINQNDNRDNIADQLKILKELYKSGDLTEEEYIKAKKKIIE